MKKKWLLVLIGCMLCVFSAGCSRDDFYDFFGVDSAYVEKSEEIHDSTFGESSLIKIGNSLYYDSSTWIVYMQFDNGYYRGYMSPYFAPNGLPYRYNPETNTFEEIDTNCKNECCITNGKEE